MNTWKEKRVISPLSPPLGATDVRRVINAKPIQSNTTPAVLKRPEWHLHGVITAGLACSLCRRPTGVCGGGGSCSTKRGGRGAAGSERRVPSSQKGCHTSPWSASRASLSGRCWRWHLDVLLSPRIKFLAGIIMFLTWRITFSRHDTLTPAAKACKCKSHH